MLEKREADVIIIGGGIMGCATAYRLAKRGVDVLVLEKKEIGNGGSCRNAGGVRQSARDPKELPLAMYAVQNIWPQLREELGGTYRTQSDAEVLLHAYQKWGEDCPRHLSGMFAFAIWDAKQHALFCARDHFGTKPLYYTKVEDVLYIASEIKALMPFLAHIETDPAAFQDYLVFQFCLGAKTLFKGVSQLEPAHSMMVRPGEQPVPRRYWQVYYEPDLDHTEAYFSRTLEELLWRSVKSCTTGEVPLGGYVSGGVDSSLTAALASQILPDFEGYVGKVQSTMKAHIRVMWRRNITSSSMS